MKKDRNYTLNTENGRLVFLTHAFRAEKTSVLHGGIYTKEFTSMLFASAMCIVAYVAVSYMPAETRIVRIVFIASTFAVSFLISRRYLFRERFLKAVFDKSDKTVRITSSGLIWGKTDTLSWESIRSIETGSTTFVPDNIDGARFVQRISLQHGSAIPRLGEEEEFVTLSLRLEDGSERVLYAGKVEDEPELPTREIRNFMGK